MKILSNNEIKELEERYVQGLTSKEVVALFQEKGIKLTTATFRKYVQLGLLPRAKRVGRGRRYSGSEGIYPPTVIRSVNLIKRLLAEDMTLEEIRESFALFEGEVNNIEGELGQLLDELEKGVMKRLTGGERRKLVAELEEARREARNFMSRLKRIGKRMSAATGTVAV